MTRAIRIGTDPNNEAEILWYPERDPHYFIVGPEGSGKTTLLRTVIDHFNSFGDTALIARSSDLVDEQLAPAVITFQTAHRSPLDYLDLIDTVHRLVAQRTRRLENKPLLLAIDSYNDIQHELAEDDPRGAREADQMLREIIRLGRSAQVHVAMTMFAPVTELLDAETRDIAFLTTLGNIDYWGAAKIWGRQGLAHQFEPGHGYATGGQEIVIRRPERVSEDVDA